MDCVERDAPSVDAADDARLTGSPGGGVDEAVVARVVGVRPGQRVDVVVGAIGDELGAPRI